MHACVCTYVLRYIHTDIHRLLEAFEPLTRGLSVRLMFLQEAPAKNGSICFPHLRVPAQPEGSISTGPGLGFLMYSSHAGQGPLLVALEKDFIRLVCVYTYIYIYINIYVYVYIHTDKSIFICIYIYIHTYTCMYIYSLHNVHMRTYVLSLCVCLCMHICLSQSAYSCIY